MSKTEKEKREKRERGRPVENVIEPIVATPEVVAKAIMQSKPKKDWDYLKSDKIEG